MTDPLEASANAYGKDHLIGLPCYRYGYNHHKSINRGNAQQLEQQVDLSRHVSRKKAVQFELDGLSLETIAFLESEFELVFCKTLSDLRDNFLFLIFALGGKGHRKADKVTAIIPGHCADQLISD